MGLSSWLKARRLERTHNKLKHLRAIQAKLRQKEADLANQRKAGAPSTELEARQRAIHEEREKLTREIHALEATERQLKAERNNTAA